MKANVRAMFDNVSRCTQSITEVVRAALAAHKSAATLPLLSCQSDTLLVGARIRRTEDLFQIMLGSLKSFDNTIQAVQEKASAVVSTPAVQVATWNTLSDQWYIDHVTVSLAILTEVFNARNELSVALEHKATPGTRKPPSYVSLVNDVHQAVQNLESAWNACLHYFDSWREVATSVMEGIGESGTLLPQT